MTDLHSQLETAFATLEAAALNNERCPQNGCYGIHSNIVGALARAGRIRVAISGHNYRQVFILTGPHKGKATAPDPTGAKPWKIIDADGMNVNGRHESGPRQQPSPPRLLPRSM